MSVIFINREFQKTTWRAIGSLLKLVVILNAQHLDIGLVTTLGGYTVAGARNQCRVTSIGVCHYEILEMHVDIGPVD